MSVEDSDGVRLSADYVGDELCGNGDERPYVILFGPVELRNRLVFDRWRLWLILDTKLIASRPQIHWMKFLRNKPLKSLI